MNRDEILRQVQDESDDLVVRLNRTLNELAANYIGKDMTPTALDEMLDHFTAVLKQAAARHRLVTFGARPEVTKERYINDDFRNRTGDCYIVYGVEDNRPKIQFVFDGIIAAFVHIRAGELGRENK